MKNFVKASLTFSILLFVFFSSCTHKQESSNSNSTFDSILVGFQDSLNSNSEYKLKILRKAETLVTDSDEFYLLKVNYCTYYNSIQKLDSVMILARNIETYIMKDPNSLKNRNLAVGLYNSLGVYYSFLNIKDSALFFYKKAYTEVVSTQYRVKIPDICINIADMYTRTGDYVNGIAFYRKALAVSDSLHIDESIKFPIYFGLGQAYFMGLRNFELSDEYFKMAEGLYKDRKTVERFIFCNNRGNFYFYKEEYNNALPWFEKAMKIVEPLHAEFYINICRVNLGDIYVHLNKLDTAEYLLDKSYNYFSSLGDKTILFYIATVKAEIAMKKGNVSQARSILKESPIIPDIEPEILGLRYKALQNFYRETSDYRNAYEIQSLALKLNDSIRSERVKNSIVELDARYKQDTTLLNREILLQAKDSELNSLRSLRLFWILIAVLSIFIALSTYLFFKRRKDIENAKQLEIISKYRLRNLRSRISPHFLFNALNRQVMSEKDPTKHTEMLEITKMLRKSLEMTDSITVALSDEIDFVRSYLIVESHGFNGDFNVIWEIDSRLDVNNWEVPAMLLQIPVENALKHALRNKSGEKTLRISIRESANDLNIMIVDNGNGYYPDTNTSTAGTKNGLKVLYSIIQLLNQHNERKLLLEIHNIEETGLTGTSVEITIPENFNYNI